MIRYHSFANQLIARNRQYLGQLVFRALAIGGVLSIPGIAYSQNCDVHSYRCDQSHCDQVHCDQVHCDHRPSGHTHATCKCKQLPKLPSLQELIINKLSVAAEQFEKSHRAHRKSTCDLNHHSNCQPSCGVPAPSCGCEQGSFISHQPTCGVAEPTCGLPEPTCGVEGMSGSGFFPGPRSIPSFQYQSPNFGTVPDIQNHLPPVTSAIPTPPSDVPFEVHHPEPFSTSPYSTEPRLDQTSRRNLPTLEAPKIQRIPMNSNRKDPTTPHTEPIQQPANPKHDDTKPAIDNLPDILSDPFLDDKASSSSPKGSSGVELTGGIGKARIDEVPANELRDSSESPRKMSRIPIENSSANLSSANLAKSGSIIQTSYLTKATKTTSSASLRSDDLDENKPKVSRRSVPKRK